MPYTLRSAPVLSTLEDVRKWVEDELGYIEQAQHDSKLVQIQPSFRDVDKPRDGMIVYADGTNFDPGGGEGSYEYRSGAWHKLAEDIDLTSIESDITSLQSSVATNTTNIATNTTAIAGPTAVTGFNNGSNAAAGKIGEYISAIKLIGAAVGLTSLTSANITSIILTAGDWDLYGEAFFFGANTSTVTFYAAAINTVSPTANPTVPTEGTDFGQVQMPSSVSANGSNTIPFSITGLRTRVNPTVTTTYFLNGVAQFGVSTFSAFGALRARRMR